MVPLIRDGGLYFIEGKPETETRRKSYGAVEKEAAMVAERDQRVKDCTDPWILVAPFPNFLVWDFSWV